MKKSMNVSNLACLALLALTLGSCKKENADNRETGSLVAKIIFSPSQGTRANSTAIPETSWTSIKQMQVFLYDATTGIIKFSDIIAPSTTTANITHTWSMVPEGTYQLVIVANAKSSTDNIATTLTAAGPATEWTGMNVRNMDSRNLAISHAPLSGGFPARIVSALPAGNTLKPFGVPSEIFMAATKLPVVIQSGQVTDISATDPLKLEREVALMRVRLRVNDKSQGYDNSDVSFVHEDASILVYTLPAKIGIRAGNEGGVANNSNEKDVLVAANGAPTFHGTDPLTGYAPTSIIDTDFRLWRDIIVFPNNGGRANPTAVAPVAQRYYVVVTGHAPENHLLADGSRVAYGGALVHWGGLVEASFEPNTIRELNLNLTSGGVIGVPGEPAKEGGLTILISEPAAWGSNIKVTDLDV
jgi:hypothetical protein